jgi:ubiquinone/menaquinone biosynthesis C-methylase UbiE
MGDPKKRDIAAQYDALGGEIYNIRYTEEQRVKYDMLLERIEPQPDDIVLDVGCGTGLLTQRLESQAVGIDISSSLLSTALSRLRGKKSAQFIMGDAEHPPIRSSSIDKIFAVTLLQNTPNPRSVLLEIKRVGRATAGVTALKKAFTRESFEKTLSQADFSSVEVVDSKGSNDWIAFVVL